MKTYITKAYTAIFKDKTFALYATQFGIGLLLHFAVSGFFHVLTEKWAIERERIGWMVVVLTITAIALLVARRLSHHVSCGTHEHTHEHKEDTVFLWVIGIACFSHTLFDGAFLFTQFNQGILIGILALFAIIFHEAIRTGVLFESLRVMKFSIQKSAFVVFALSGLGLLLGASIAYFGTTFFEAYEVHIQVLTSGLNLLVAADLFWWLQKGGQEKTFTWKRFMILLLLGILTPFLLESFHH